MCDHDGTLAPIVEDPAQATPSGVDGRPALAGRLPETAVARISGRALRELAGLSRLPTEVRLIGSHCAEFDGGFAHAAGR